MSFSLYGNTFSKLPDSASDRRISFVLAALLFSVFLHISLGWYGLHALKDIEVKAPKRSLEFSLVKPPDPIITPPIPLPTSTTPRIAPSPAKPKLIQRPASPKPELPKSEPIREPVKPAEIVENKTEITEAPLPSLQLEETPTQLHETGEQTIAMNPTDSPVISSGGEVGEGHHSGGPANEAIAGTAPGGGGEVVGPIFDADYLNNPVPPYPPAARKLKLQGTVVVRVLVNPLGKAEIVQVEKSSGVSILDGAALKAVKQWFFVPAREGNNPVSAWVDVPIRFRLN